MNITIRAANFLILAATLVCITACDQNKTAKKKLLGKWTAISETFEREGEPKIFGAHKPNAVTLEFFEDNTYAMNDNEIDVPRITRGRFEVLDGHILKRTLVEFERPGAKVDSAAQIGRVTTSDFSFFADRLKITRELKDGNGKKVGVTEGVYIKAPPR